MKSDIGTELRGLMTCVASVEARHLFEIAAVLWGIKKAVRVVLRPHELSIARDTLIKLGLSASEAPFRLAVAQTTSLNDSWTFHVAPDDRRAEWGILYAARDLPQLEEALRREAESSSDLGALLGYPSCCVKAYEDNYSEGVDWVHLLIEDWRKKHNTLGVAPPLANKLAYLFDGISLLPDYFPCSLYCSDAAALAASHRVAAQSCGLEDLVTVAERRLIQPIVVWRGSLLQASEHEVRDECTILFDGRSAPRFDWGAAANEDIVALAKIKGCTLLEDGLLLLDDDRKPMRETKDRTGALIRFGGTSSAI